MLLFFSIWVFLTDTDDSKDSRGKSGDHLLFHPATSPADEHSDINLQLYTWDDYHIFLIALRLFTRLQLDEIYHPIELPFDWLMMGCYFLCLLDDLILGLCYNNLAW